MLPVRTFTSAAEMKAHYKAVNDRLVNGTPAKPKAPTAVIAEDISEVMRRLRLVARQPSFKEVEVREKEFTPKPGPFEAKKIIAHVAAKHDLKAEEILGEGKSRPIVTARWEAILLVHRTNPGWSLPKLGRIFKRDHTSILNALRQMGAR